MEKTELLLAKALASLSRLVFVILFAVFYAAWRGYALFVLWSWFASPAGLPQISFQVAAGVSLAASLLFSKSTTPNNTPPLWVLCVNGIVMPALVLFVGWLLKVFL